MCGMCPSDALDSGLDALVLLSLVYKYYLADSKV